MEESETNTVDSYKVVMLGESGVGKTCIVNRYVNDKFTATTSTSGANYNSKIETVRIEGCLESTKVKL